jgi:hypothetical protein
MVVLRMTCKLIMLCLVFSSMSYAVDIKITYPNDFLLTCKLEKPAHSNVVFSLSGLQEGVTYNVKLEGYNGGSRYHSALRTRTPSFIYKDVYVGEYTINVFEKGKKSSLDKLVVNKPFTFEYPNPRIIAPAIVKTKQRISIQISDVIAPLKRGAYYATLSPTYYPIGSHDSGYKKRLEFCEMQLLEFNGLPEGEYELRVMQTKSGDDTLIYKRVLTVSADAIGSAPSPSVLSMKFRSQFLEQSGQDIIDRVMKESLLWDLDGVYCQAEKSANNDSLPTVSAMTAVLDKMLTAVGSSGDDLEMLNYGRNAKQPFSISHNDVMGDGWSLAPSDETAFHRIGIERGEYIKKYIHDDGREYVFYEEPNTQPIPVFDDINDGTYNYSNATIKHLVFDVYPWVLYGATPEDPTTINERMSELAGSDKAKKAFSYTRKLCDLL